jgi:site-specific recombinase XerD
LLSADEVSAIVEAPDRATVAGRRDYALLLLLTQTTLNASEILDLDLQDCLDEQGDMILAFRRRGKAIKHRLGAQATNAVRAVRSDRALTPGENRALFVSVRGRRLTKDAVLEILRRAIFVASTERPALLAWCATIPALRRSTAMIRSKLGVAEL